LLVAELGGVSGGNLSSGLGIPVQSIQLPVEDSAATPSTQLPLFVFSGVGLQVRVQGPGCQTMNWTSSSILTVGSDKGFNATSEIDDATGATTHTLTCTACVFTPLSAVVMILDASCQFVLVHASAVAGNGDVVLHTVPFTSGIQVRRSANDTQLAHASLSLTPLMEIFSDVTDGQSWRGYELTVQNVAMTYSNGPPDAVVITIALAASPFYMLVTYTHLQSTLQLLSSIIGLMGIVTMFANAFMLLEFTMSPSGRILLRNTIRALGFMRKSQRQANHAQSAERPSGRRQGHTATARNGQVSPSRALSINLMARGASGSLENIVDQHSLPSACHSSLRTSAILLDQVSHAAEHPIIASDSTLASGKNAYVTNYLQGLPQRVDGQVMDSSEMHCQHSMRLQQQLHEHQLQLQHQQHQLQQYQKQMILLEMLVSRVTVGLPVLQNATT
jgi:hypothetical protein